jgi:hypothetical protein
MPAMMIDQNSVVYRWISIFRAATGLPLISRR